MGTASILSWSSGLQDGFKGPAFCPEIAPDVQSRCCSGLQGEPRQPQPTSLLHSMLNANGGGLDPSNSRGFTSFAGSQQGANDGSYQQPGVLCSPVLFKAV